MRRGLPIVLILAAGMCLAAHPSGGTPKLARSPEIRLHLRAHKAPETVIEEMPLPYSDYPYDIDGGLPGWLTSIPDSEKAIVTIHDKGVRLLFHRDPGTGPLTIEIWGYRSRIRSATFPVDSTQLRMWTWDLRDSSGLRVRTGVYWVFADAERSGATGCVVVGGSR